jgi:hypothetical protein
LDIAILGFHVKLEDVLPKHEFQSTHAVAAACWMVLVSPPVGTKGQSKGLLPGGSPWTEKWWKFCEFWIIGPEHIFPKFTG